MAGLKEYFKTDLRAPFRLEAKWKGIVDRVQPFSFESAVILDPDAGARYLAFYLSSRVYDEFIYRAIIDHLEYYLDKANNVVVGPGGGSGSTELLVANHGDHRVSLIFNWPGHSGRIRDADLRFTRRVYFYSESAIEHRERVRLEEYATGKGLALILRGPDYAAERDLLEQPKAFISQSPSEKRLSGNSVL